MADAAFIEEIKYRNDIEEVISSYVQLHRAGSNYNALCPFHSEKTPSFTVFPSQKSFYCFGCGAGGDVITFIMRAENLDFYSAVEFLAKRAGLEVPQSPGQREESVRRTRLYEMNRVAAHFFHEQLKKSQPALKYLMEKRRLQQSVINHFGLGFAPDGFGQLTDYMHGQGFTDEELTIGFLCGKSQKNGRVYDYFRNRIMFPIIDVSGNVIAFGGRVMDDSKPKYLNSSDTPAFKKSRNLFALNYAKKDCAEQLVLCEGYMDVIAMHAAGFTNAVATLGTAITPEQARLMKRHTNRVVISYDNDSAGQRAAERAFQLLSDAGLETRILRMEGAKDPDEYIKKFGKERFQRLLQESVSQFEFVLSNILNKYNIASLEEKVKAAQKAVDFIAGVNSEVERELYIYQVAEKLTLPVDSLKNDVKRKRSRNEREQSKSRMRQIILQTSGIGDKINPERVKNLRGTKAEETILGILLLYPEYISAIRKGEISLLPDDFVTTFHRQIFEALLEEDEAGHFDVSLLGEHFTPEEMGQITKLKIERASLKKNDAEVLQECAEALKSSRRTEDLEELIHGKRNEITGKR